MERFLLLWDEMDDFIGIGRHVVGGALSEVADATGRAAAQMASWTTTASGWLSPRQME
jgi:hypothetical protein